MAEGNHFLNIPQQDALFTTIKSGRTGDRRDCDVEDEDDEEAEENVRFIPRCSPIPRKRGSSIIDETAEYMRIRLVLARRVSFADASGSDLADVREFVPFDSDDEDETWEEEEEKMRRSYREPVYKLWPEIPEHIGDELIRAVRANRVEVDSVTPVQDDQLSFNVIICVLNVSYHKSVWVRATTDGWITYSESPALYVPDSSDGDTDRFSTTLTFTEPYLFNGARIDFVVRYETPDGEFWANNLRKNYSVTLLVSYEDTSQVTNVTTDVDVRGILKPPKNRMEYVSDLSQDQDEDDFDSEERPADVSGSSSICPVVIEPEIDIEIPEAKSVTSSKTSEDPNPAECDLQVSPKIQQTDHIQHISQVTDSALFSDSISISLQKCTDVRIGHLDNQLTAYPDKLSEDSHSTQCSSKNPDDALSDVTSQVPFDVGITLPVMLSSTQCMDEDQTEEENKELTSGGAQLQDQASDKRQVDKTKMSLPELQESIKPCRFNEFEILNASKVEDFSHSTDHILVDDINHFVQPEMHTHHELKEQEQEEVPVIATICMWEPFEVTQNNPPRTSEMDVSKYYEQKSKSELDLNELAKEGTTQVKSNKLYNASKEEEHFSYDTVQDSLSNKSQMSIAEIPRMDSEEHEAAVKRDTDQQEQVGLRGEDNYMKCPEKLTDIKICRQQPNVLTYFEQSCTLEESVPQNVSNFERTPDPELSEYPEQRRESEPDLKGLADFKSEDTDNIGEKPSLDSEELKAAIRRDTDQEEQVGIKEDHYKIIPEESCILEESVPQNVSNSEKTPGPELTGYPEQRRESEPDLKGPSDFKAEDTDKEEPVGIMGDNCKHCPDEISEINICCRQPHVLTSFEHTYENNVPQTFSDSKITFDPDVVEYPEQREESESDPKELADFISDSKSLALVSVSELTFVRNKQYNNSTGHDMCSGDFQNKLVEKPEVQNEKHKTEVKMDKREETLADLQTESYQAGEDNPVEWQPVEVDNQQKVDDTSDQEVSFALFNFSETTSASASNFKEDFCQSTGHNMMYTDFKNTLVKELEMQTLLVDDHLEQTKETKVFLSCSNLPTTAYPEIPKNHGQLQKSGSNLELDVFTMKDKIPSEEISFPTFVCEGTTTSQDFFTTVEAVSSEGEDGNSSSTQEEMEDLSFNEDFELFYEEPAPRQKQEGLSSQLLLPNKTLQASSAQCNTSLGQVLIPSLVAFSTVLCLVIGFNEPIVFLFVLLFLVSLCF